MKKVDKGNFGGLFSERRQVDAQGSLGVGPGFLGWILTLLIATDQSRAKRASENSKTSKNAGGVNKGMGTVHQFPRFLTGQFRSSKGVNPDSAGTGGN